MLEIAAYKLLHSLNVPTLPVYGITEAAILLEDLSSSAQWCLATEDDVTRADVGAAVGRWYRVFHTKGEVFLQQEGQPTFLHREAAALNGTTIREAAKALDLGVSPVWETVIGSLALLKQAESRLSITLNVNDFHWTNLALNRRDGRDLAAVVFDYHLLGVGMRYSDCRNVTGSLGSQAKSAFWDEYGQVDPREKVIDRPLSAIYSLVVAAKLPKFPRWATASRELVRNGRLLADLRDAITLAEALR